MHSYSFLKTIYLFFVLMGCTDIPVMQHGLPYMWAVIIPALANLAWGIVVWTTVPARPEQASVLSVDLKMANRVVMTRKLLFNYLTCSRTQ